MANRKVTKDVSDALISAAVIASFWGEKHSVWLRNTPPTTPKLPSTRVDIISLS